MKYYVVGLLDIDLGTYSFFLIIYLLMDTYYCSGQTNCLLIIQRKRRWIGQALSKPVPSITRQALNWKPQGKRKRGRPMKTWRHDLEETTKKTVSTWRQFEALAQNRDVWKALVSCLFPRRGDTHPPPQPMHIYFKKFFKLLLKLTPFNFLNKKNCIHFIFFCWLQVQIQEGWV